MTSSDGSVPDAAAPGVEKPRDRTVSTRLIILALVAVLVVPGILFSGVLLYRYAQAESAQYELQSVGVARSAAAVLESEVTGLQRTLETLTTSKFLQEGDLAGFYEQAQRVKAAVGSDIGLRSLDGQQLVNTRVPWGTVLPRTPFEKDAEVIAKRGPVVTDVFTGAIARRALIAIVVPVILGGEPRYLLHVSSDTERFYNVIKPVAPSGWLIGVADRHGAYVTRSENHQEFTGKPGLPAFLSRAAGREGIFTGKSAFGENVLVGYVRTGSDWVVAASVRESVIEAPLREALYLLIGFGALVLICASLIALRLWRFIAEPLAGLARAGRDIGELHAPSSVPTRLREFQAVQDALAAAAAQVRATTDMLEVKVEERTRELEQANAELTAQMSAREKAESQLRQMQKMEAVGQLTGGIAHDFNNMLAIVISSLDLMQRRLERGDTSVERFVASALDGARRAAGLTNRLLAFSRQQPLAPEVIEPNRLVTGMSELLQRTLGQTTKIETVLGAGLWKTHADGAQLENAILNLCVNARDAMPDGGRLTIETSNAFLDEAYIEAHQDDALKPGQYVQIAVTDTGTGMSTDILSRAFDPFFTTKRIGMGTGLGLSQVYGFVKQSNGQVKIYSEPGQGTTIRIYLPRYYGQEESRPLRREAKPLLAGSPGEVILVVEDEEGLRNLTVATLTELGYTVLEAGHATTALQILDTHPEIKLLFTDIVMPDINGRKLADQALARRPDLLVVYTTGFTRNAVVHNGVLDAGVHFIAKPFSMEDLAARIRQVLSGT
jgi:signal transduction histidine kinase